MANVTDAELHRLESRRNGSLFLVASGFALMFLGSWAVQLALGGAAMVLAGAGGTFYWGRRIKKAKGDPWAYDPELDGPDPRNPRDPIG